MKGFVEVTLDQSQMDKIEKIGTEILEHIDYLKDYKKKWNSTEIKKIMWILPLEVHLGASMEKPKKAPYNCATYSTAFDTFRFWETSWSEALHDLHKLFKAGKYRGLEEGSDTYKAVLDQEAVTLLYNLEILDL